MRISKPADLARLIKTRRHAQGRTQQDVADSAGITRQSLARIERGNGGISFDTLLLILDTLGIRLDGTAVEGSGTGPRLVSVDTAEGATADVTPKLDSFPFSLAMLHQFALAAAATNQTVDETLAGLLDQIDLEAPFPQPFSYPADEASRAALRLAIEQGDPARTNATGDAPGGP